MKRTIKINSDKVDFTYAGEKTIEVKGDNVKFTYEDDISISSPPAVMSSAPVALHSDIRKLAHDNCYKEITALSTRADLFLVSQAILLEAYFSALKECLPEINAVALVIGLLGVFIAVTWLLIGLRQDLRINYLSEAVVRGGDKSDKIFAFHNNLENAIEAFSCSFTRVSATPILALYLPLTVLIAWLLLIYSQYDKLDKRLVILVALISFVSFIVMARFRKKFTDPECDELYK